MGICGVRAELMRLLLFKGGCRYMQDERPVSSFAELKKVMEGNGFQLKVQEEMPFVIREHARKFQWGCAQGSVWIKTA